MLPIVSKFRIGWSVKGTIKDAVSTRIAETAAQLATMREGDALKPVTVEHTFLSFDEANKHSGRDKIVVKTEVEGAGYRVYYTEANWVWAEHPGLIDWPTYIKAHPVGSQPKKK